MKVKFKNFEYDRFNMLCLLSVQSLKMTRGYKLH